MKVEEYQSDRYAVQLKRADEKKSGTVGKRKASKKGKKKKLKYNAKELSMKVLNARTSFNARIALASCRSKVAMLERQRRSGEYDEGEIRSAIRHATQISMAAAKRKRHLESEEQEAIAKKAKENDKKKRPKKNQSKEKKAMLEKRLKQLQKELQETQQKKKEIRQNAAWDQDFKQRKQKHRSEERNDVLDADMKYLSAMIRQAEQEQQEQKYSNDNDFGVSLEIGGVEMTPADTAVSADVPVEAGAVVDVSL